MHDTATLKTRKAPAQRQAAAASEAGAMVVRFRPAIPFGDRELIRFCQQNAGLRIERSSRGDIIIMPPASGDAGRSNAELTADFVLWARQAATGTVFDSSSGFRLPDQSMLSPDVSWVARERLDELSQKDWQSFMSLCPDFVLELRSRSDRLPTLQKKMALYIANGARLGWLLDPLERQVFVYRPGAKVEHLKNPATLSGEPVLAGFTLDLARVW